MKRGIVAIGLLLSASLLSGEDSLDLLCSLREIEQDTIGTLVYGTRENREETGRALRRWREKSVKALDQRAAGPDAYRYIQEMEALYRSELALQKRIMDEDYKPYRPGGTLYGNLEDEERGLLLSRLQWEEEFQEAIEGELLLLRTDHLELRGEAKEWLKQAKTQFDSDLYSYSEALRKQGVQRSQTVTEWKEELVNYAEQGGRELSALVDEYDRLCRFIAISRKKGSAVPELCTQASELEGLFSREMERYSGSFPDPVQEEIRSVQFRISLLSSFQEALAAESTEDQDLCSYDLAIAREQRKLTFFRELSRRDRCSAEVEYIEELLETASAISEAQETYHLRLSRAKQAQNEATLAYSELRQRLLSSASRESTQPFLSLLQGRVEDSSLKSLLVSAAARAQGEGMLSADIIQHNQALRKLISVLDLSPAKLGRLNAEEQERELYPLIFSDGALQGDLPRLIRQGMQACLNRHLVEDVLSRAERKRHKYENLETSFIAQASVYSATAAICYASLNIPGGIAATAAAVAAASSAAAFGEKKRDLQALISMTDSGSAAFDQKLSSIYQELQNVEQAEENVRRSEQELLAVQEAPWPSSLEKERALFLSSLEELGTVDAAFSRVKAQVQERFDLLCSSRKEALSPEEFLEARGKLLNELLASYDTEGSFSRELLKKADDLYSIPYQTKLSGLWLKAEQGKKLLFDQMQALQLDACFSLQLRRENLNFADECGQEWLSSWAQLREKQIEEGRTLWDKSIQNSREALQDTITERRGEYIEGSRGYRRRIEEFSQRKEAQYSSLFAHKASELEQRLLATFPTEHGVPLPIAHSYCPEKAGTVDEHDVSLPSVDQLIGGRDPIALLGDIGLQVRKDLKQKLADLKRDRIRSEQRIASALDRGLRRSLLGRLADEEARLKRTAERENRRAQMQIADRLGKSGYTVDRLHYHRRVLVDLWLGGQEWEEQRIASYRYFVPPDFSWEGRVKELSQTDLQGSDLNLFMAAVARETGKVFGGTDSLFSIHLGTPPAMGNAGSGELGRIFGLYQEQEENLGRGLSRMDTAFYDRRFWDDDRDNDGRADSFFSAPTIRSSSELLLELTTSGLGLGPLAGIGLSLCDDLLFSLGDMAAGKQAWDQALFGLAKKGAIGALSTLPMKEGLAYSASSAARNLANSGISSLRLTDGGLSVDGEGLSQSLFSGDSVRSYLSDSLGAYTKTLYRRAVLEGDASYGFNQKQRAELSDAGNLASGLLSEGAELALGGTAEFNLLNSSRFGLGSCGLVRLQLGSDASSLSLQSGGRELSPLYIASGFHALDHLQMKEEISSYSAMFSPDIVDPLQKALLLQYGFGNEAAGEQLKMFLHGEDRLSVSPSTLLAGTTPISLTCTDGGQRRVSLSFNGDDQVSPFLMGVLLQHEAERDGLHSPINSLETQQAVQAHADFVQGLIADPKYGVRELEAFPFLQREQELLAQGRDLPYEAYDSRYDFFRLEENRTVFFDGSHHLWSSGGALLNSHRRGSFSQSLADHFGITRQAALGLMRDSGLRWDRELGDYIDTDPDRGIELPGALQAVAELRDRFASSYVDRTPGGLRTSYVWALREDSLRGSMKSGAAVLEDREFILRRREDLSSFSSFLSAIKAGPREGFQGVQDRASFHHYSQQNIERAVTGSALGGGDGYCLAEAIAYAFTERYPSIGPEKLQDLFSEADFNNTFSKSNGFVGDKEDFSRIIADYFNTDAYIKESRFNDFSELKKAAKQTAHDYFIIADYAGHFTHVRKDGMEINSYSGWSSKEKQPIAWRLMEWETDD